jgi:hypothetical protein
VVLCAALFAVALTSAQPPVWDRARLADALERMIVSGEPRHVDHDEGEELQAALSAALPQADADLKALATRAAIPIVARIAHPLFNASDPEALDIRAARILTLPWDVSFTATIEARSEGAAWRRIARVASGQNSGDRLDRILPRTWLSPGFHDLDLRARIEYDAAPGAMPAEEVRPLPSLHYGVWSAPNDIVARFIDRGRYASVARLDAGLPDVPLAIWLMQLPYATQGVEAAWRTEWCALAAHPSAEGQMLTDVCAVATFQAPQSTVAEVWVRIGSLDENAQGAPWKAADPTLEAAFLRRTGRAPVRLALIPTLIAADEQSWPTSKIEVEAADLAVTPAAPRPGHAATLTLVVSNSGVADAYGIAIEVLAGSSDQPALKRRFVRDIAAGERVELSLPVTYSMPYGWVMVHAKTLTDHAEWPVLDDVSRPNQALALRVINAKAAPPGFGPHLCQQVVGEPCASHRSPANVAFSFSTR